MQTILEENDEEIKMYERESMQTKEKLDNDSVKERESNYNRFTNCNDNIFNAIEGYQNENENYINDNVENDINNKNNDNLENIKINDTNKKNINEEGDLEDNTTHIRKKSKCLMVNLVI